LLLPDVNVLLYAHREDSHPEHARYAGWVTALAAGAEPFALSVLVLTGVLRIATNPRIFLRPSTLDEALDFAGELLRQPTARLVGPGPRHWELMTELCRKSGATGKLVADAAHAAVALEHGCTLVTTDADFGRFPGLRWRHPLAPDQVR
jgi:toxin-antitoxin system PIN domain toxin